MVPTFLKCHRLGILFLAAPLLVPTLEIRTAAQANATASLTIHASDLSSNQIPRNLTGKFCEHLGANIYNGMDAQILRNPTFADYPIFTGQMSPDGIATFQSDRARIDEQMRRQAQRSGWPEADLSGLMADRQDGLAAFWGRDGEPDTVKSSPDTGPHGGRAQRLEFKAGGGIKQWVWLPLHRMRKFEFEIFARSPDLTTLKLSLHGAGSDGALVDTSVVGITTAWQKIKGSFTLPESVASNEPVCLVISSATAGQLVIGHVFLWPADHIHRADPDVVRLLRDAHLPLLRWPGGNFVSAYHWQDGVGPIEQRPTKPNYAWGGVEPNTFGTHEFIAFCQGVGCEPMICVNAGNGTAEEAAAWVEYCNGPASSPMGALRAANGHPEPFQVRHWEVGNELWGRWQAHWTTGPGYVDRYRHFAEVMLRADPTLRLYACGAPVLWGKNWNDTLIAGVAPDLPGITDHPLIGGNVSRSVDPLDVYRDFMHVPDILERKWGDLRESMAQAGVQRPRLAVTELQLFAHLGQEAAADQTERLNRENLVNPGTLAEAIYDTLIYHAAVRLQPFVEMITHSATVNHGGGLRKEREVVYANPCYYANQLFADFAEARPVRIELQSPEETAPMALPDIKNEGGSSSFPVVAALAAVDPKGDLLVSLVHRGSTSPIQVRINLDGVPKAQRARAWTLGGPNPWTANTLEAPKAILPIQTELEIRDHSLNLLVQPFSLVQLRLQGSE